MSNLIKRAFYCLYNVSGARYIVEKMIITPDPITGRKKPITFVLWLIGIYVSLFSIASVRYENRIDIIENRANAIFTHLATDAYKPALERIPSTKTMVCPIQPDIFNPFSIVFSFTKNAYYGEINDLLNGVLESWKTRFIDLTYTNVIFENLDFSGANFDGSTLSGVQFVNTSLNNSQFLGATLNSVLIIGDCNLSNSNFTGSQLIDINIKNAQFKDSVFRETIFQDSHFDSCDFSNTDLSLADLSGSEFINCNFSYAKMGKTILKNTILTGSIFDTADILVADFTNADITSASFINTKNLFADKLVVAKSLRNITVPDSILEEINFLIENHLP